MEIRLGRSSYRYVASRQRGMPMRVASLFVLVVPKKLKSFAAEAVPTKISISSVGGPLGSKEKASQLKQFLQK